MRKLNLLFGLALAMVLGVSVTACDDKDEKIIDDNQGPVFGISKNDLIFGEYGNYSNPDTVAFETEDWTLTSILLSDEPLFIHDVEDYVVELAGLQPFSTSAGWLDINYSNKQMVLKANENFEPENADEWPQYRYARLVFEHGGAIDSLRCQQVSDMPSGDVADIMFNPNYVVMPANGGTVSFKTNIFMTLVTSVTLDGETTTYCNPDYDEFWNVYAPGIMDKKEVSITDRWLTIERFGPESDPDEFVLTLAPNKTGTDREFVIGFHYSASPALVWTTTMRGSQRAE